MSGKREAPDVPGATGSARHPAPPTQAAGPAALDSPGPVRPGEELDEARLGAWLAERLPDFGASGLPLSIEQFPGGHSNLTYLLTAGSRELVLRRPPFGSKVETAHDMGREFRVLSRLADLYPKAPRALLFADAASSPIGAPFYLMERVRGVILRGQRPPAGLDLSPDRMHALSAAAVDGLAELHAVDFRAAGLDGLGRPEGYVERQVTGWAGRWQAAATGEVPEIDRAFAWLAANLPANHSAPALLHNDYKYDNLVLAAGSGPILAVLDWEMATLGDPLMDLGTSLGYWIDPDDDPAMRALPAGPTALAGNLSRAEVAERYALASGRDVSEVLFHYVYGLLKIAAIAQQIYFRYRQGLTADPRFAALPAAVQILGRATAQALARRRIDRLWG